MFLVISLLVISLLVISLLSFISFLISESCTLSREEASSYECGFEHHNLSRVPFSLRYFFLTLIFLLFDLEVVLIVFLPYSLFSYNFVVLCFVVSSFVFILLSGLIYEWSDGSLEWLN